MKPYAWAVIGGCVASIGWIVVVLWLLDCLAAACACAQREYDQLGAQVRELLDQNARLARILVATTTALKADATRVAGDTASAAGRAS